jgi:hypothetical protein
MPRLRLKFGTVLVSNAARTSLGKPPIPLTVLAVIILAMAFLTVYDTVIGARPNVGPVFFRCTNCGNVAQYTVRELQKMLPPGQAGPMMGPLVLTCPKCNKNTFTQAVKCPKCGEVFVLKFNPAANIFDDKCPKCHESYAKTWREKYRKETGE